MRKHGRHVVRVKYTCVRVAQSVPVDTYLRARATYDGNTMSKPPTTRRTRSTVNGEPVESVLRLLETCPPEEADAHAVEFAKVMRRRQAERLPDSLVTFAQSEKPKRWLLYLTPSPNNFGACFVKLPPQACSNCLFYPEPQGSCRRRAPTVDALVPTPWSGGPRVLAASWCGEYAANLALGVGWWS